jgi:hypothetical protein
VLTERLTINGTITESGTDFSYRPWTNLETLAPGRPRPGNNAPGGLLGEAPAGRTSTRVLKSGFRGRSWRSLFSESAEKLKTEVAMRSKPPTAG